MTNSPPSNVKLNESEARALASGIDSLVLAIDVEWLSTETFELLALLKAAAKDNHSDAPGVFTFEDGTNPWIFNVVPNGVGGYEWLLHSHDLALKIGSSMTPTSRPSLMAEIRSETLWTLSAEAAVAWVIELLAGIGARVIHAKPSRVDLCVDVLIHESEWSTGLTEHFVTRARDVKSNLQHGELSGFSIGKGAMSARLYDKPREIALISHKEWMYDIWGIDSIDADHRVVRVEFQLRRSTLKELGVDTWDHLTSMLPEIWAYCTKKWLRIVHDASVHHTQQVVMPWWQVVTDGFTGAQGAEPLVRRKAIIADKKQIARQLLGCASSIVALQMQGDVIRSGETLDLETFLELAVREAVAQSGYDDDEFTYRVRQKQAKRSRQAGRLDGAGSIGDVS